MSYDNDSLDREIAEPIDQSRQIADQIRSAKDLGQKISGHNSVPQTGAGSAGAGSAGAGTGINTAGGADAKAAASGLASSAETGSSQAAAGSAGAKAASTGKTAVKGTAKKTGKVAGKAAKSVAGSLSAPVIAVIAAVSLLFLICYAVLTVGTPSTSFNSWSHINEIQDPVDEDELDEDGTANGFSESRTKAVDAEAEGINLTYKVLKEAETDAYDELEDQVNRMNRNSLKADIDYDTTKAFLTRASKISSGSEIFSVTDGQKNEDTGWGYFTEDQIDSCEMLAAYSISVDNLWGKDYLGSGGIGGIDLESIDISDTEGKAKYMYVALRKEGYSHNAACGVLGNIQQESNFNPKVVNSIGASGIVQWYQGRASRMKSYVSGKYGSWTDYKGQVEFMIKEIKESYGRVHRGLSAENVSLADATWVVLRYYEIPGNFSAEQTRRLNFARKWSDKFQNLSELSAGGGIDTSGINAPTPAAKGAIAWAVTIANDDSFAYGGGKAAHNRGCYFCKTQGKKKRVARQEGHGDEAERFEKTYCCNCFCFSAYAHGGNDQKMLRSCKRGSNADVDFENWGFRKIRNPSWSEVENGDVIRVRGNDHFLMIVDKKKNTVVHAGSDGKFRWKGHNWSKDSITVAGGAKKWVAKAKCIYRYTGDGNGIPNVTMDGLSAPKSSSSNSGIDGALKWAKKIADDDSYTYHYPGGCPVCNTKLAKGYVCDTFVKAAFAHGAGDSEAEKWCKGAVGTVQGVKKAMDKSSNWENLGAIPQSQLKKGDVIIWSGHMEIYYGNGERIGAHNSSLKKSDQVSVLPLYGGWQTVMRYKGKGSGGGTKGGVEKKAYSKFTVLKTITPNDVEVVCEIKRIGQARVPQSFVITGDNSFTVTQTSAGAHAGASSAYLVNYKDGRMEKKSSQLKSVIAHGNGLAYNKKTNTLYSVAGFGSHSCQIFDANTLRKKGSKRLPVPAAAICYDGQVDKFYTASGPTIHILNGQMTSKQRTISKKGQWKSAQDQGTKQGIIYNIACTNKHKGKNRVNMYGASDGKYYGTYKVEGAHWELEGIDIDDNGRLLLCVFGRDGTTSCIYRTKDAIALGSFESGSSDEEENGQAGNWRSDMPERLRSYIQTMKAEGKNPVYKLVYQYDSKGNIAEFSGVIDDRGFDTEPIVQEKIIADGKSRNVVVGYERTKRSGNSRKGGGNGRVRTNRHKTRGATRKEVIRFENVKIKNNGQFLATQDQIMANSEAKLKEGKYIKATIEKQNIAKLGFEAFGVTNEKVKELYGTYSRGTEIVEDMALNSMALLHDVNDFSDEYKVTPEYKENATNMDVDDGGLDYRLQGQLGTYRIYFACFCGNRSCKEHVKALGITTTPKGFAPGVSCWRSSKNKTILENAIIHSPRLGLLTVDGTCRQTTKDPYIVLYLGKKHKEAVKMMKFVRSADGKNSNAAVYSFRLAVGPTLQDVRDFGNSVSGTAGGWLWPTPGITRITSYVGHRASPGGIGSTNHAGLDIGAPEGTKVRASRSGTVIKAVSQTTGYGKHVIIEHQNGYVSKYAHLSKISVTEGQTVHKGEIVGLSGNTGNSTGAHLHFEIRKGGPNGTVIDPLTLIPESRRK